MVYAALVALLLGAALLMTIRSNASLRRLGAPSTAQGRESGSFEDYLARIESLARDGHRSFFITAVEQNGPRFVQVRVSPLINGTLGYQLDMPSVDWSHAYIEQIATEAQKRGRRPVLDDTGAITFLDIDFPTSGEHAVFARWIVTEVFRHTRDTRYDIEWG